MAIHALSERSSQFLNLLLGISSEKFKLNYCTYSYRLGGHTAVLHLGTAKADFVTVEAEFELLTPSGDLAAGDFVYESQDQYLHIVNIDPIVGLVQDGDTEAVPTVKDIFADTVSTNIPYPKADAP